MPPEDGLDDLRRRLTDVVITTKRPDDMTVRESIYNSFTILKAKSGVGYLYRFAVSGEVDMAASIATVVPSDCGFTARHLYLTTTKLIVINRTATGFLSVVAVNVP